MRLMRKRKSLFIAMGVALCVTLLDIYILRTSPGNASKRSSPREKHPLNHRVNVAVDKVQEPLYEPLTETKTQHHQKLLERTPQQNLKLLQTTPQQKLKLLQTTPQQKLKLLETTPQQKLKLLETTPQQNKKLLETTPQQKLKLLETTLQQNKKLLATTLQQKLKLLETTLQQNKKLLETTPQHYIKLLQTIPQQNQKLLETTPQHNLKLLQRTPQNAPEPPAIPRICQPKRHIVFLKTHKTGSSTILNILCRYAENHDLTFALPGHYSFYYPYPFISSYVKGFNPKSKTQYDIIGHHMKFNLKEVQKLMPEDSLYFTIFRDPASIAVSTFSYYPLSFGEAPSIHAFISNPSFYAKNGTMIKLAHNPLWFDFGLDSEAPFTEALAEAGVRTVEKTFKLVLFAEHFDESLILLKEELCWELDDVVSFKLNSRNSSTRLKPEEVEKLRQWNDLDWYLYKHFNRTFWEKVERFGKLRMHNEVTKLRERRRQLAEMCLESQEPIQAEDIKDKAIKPFQHGPLKVLGWVVKKDLPPSSRNLCVQMVRPELQYKDILDQRQFPQKNNSTETIMRKKKTPAGIATKTT